MNVESPSKLNPSLAWLLTAGAFYGLFVLGSADNLKGPTLPEIQVELGLSYSIAATILMMARVGFVMASLGMGLLVDRAGARLVILLAGIFMFSGALGYSTFQSIAALAVSMLTLGLGHGSVEVGASALVVQVHARDRGRYLNLMATFFGLGAMLAPLLAGQIIQAGFSWRMVYRWALLPIGALFLSFLALHVPRPQPAAGYRSPLAGRLRLAFSGGKAWFYLIIGFYVATEVGIASWMVEFLQAARGFSVVASSSYLSIFFGLIMGGRFFGSFVVERAGYVRSALIAAAGAAVCIAVGIFGPPWTAIFLALTGICMSIIHPTVTAAVSRLDSHNTGSALGLLFAFGGLGGMLGPVIVGLASDRLGIGLGMGAVLGLCLMMVAGLLVTWRRGSALI